MVYPQIQYVQFPGQYDRIYWNPHQQWNPYHHMHEQPHWYPQHNWQQGHHYNHDGYHHGHSGWDHHGYPQMQNPMYGHNPGEYHTH